MATVSGRQFWPSLAMHRPPHSRAAAVSLVIREPITQMELIAIAVSNPAKGGIPLPASKARS